MTALPPHTPQSSPAVRPAEEDPSEAAGGRRAAIMQAAVELFAERGFHGTAMPLVAERAGVSAGLIYRYFENKEALVNAVFQHWRRRLDDLLFHDFSPDRPFREQFKLWWQRAFGLALERPEVITFMKLHHHTPYLDETSREMVRRQFDRILAYFEQAIAAGVLKPLPADALFAMVDGMVIGLIQRHFWGVITLTPELLEKMETCAWEAVRG